MSIVPDAAAFIAGADGQADKRAADGALRMGTPRRGAVKFLTAGAVFAISQKEPN
jgi:hypothetical protein